MIYIGAGETLTPLGENISQNFEQTLKNISSVKPIDNVGFNNESLPLSVFNNSLNINFSEYLIKSINLSIKEIDEKIIQNSDTIFILSTTKGDLLYSFERAITRLSEIMISHFQLKNAPICISNACVSGVLSINFAADLIKSKQYKHAIVVGADVVSSFVVYGFQSLYALSNEICKPFDKNRKGINLGDAFATIVLSETKSIFKKNPQIYLAGSSANDANHISGPSRTAEGLCRTVRSTLQSSGIDEQDIDFISAHGTATLFNDEMEAIGFDRLKMSAIETNSLKGYFGHTLGAAGILETVISMKSMEENVVLKSYGFEENGTSKNINICKSNIKKEINCFLKTASGFGGTNSSLIIRKSI